jgi:hypothetical protein
VGTAGMHAMCACLRRPRAYERVDTGSGDEQSAPDVGASFCEVRTDSLRTGSRPQQISSGDDMSRLQPADCSTGAEDFLRRIEGVCETTPTASPAVPDAETSGSSTQQGGGGAGGRGPPKQAPGVGGGAVGALRERTNSSLASPVAKTKPPLRSPTRAPRTHSGLLHTGVV